MTSIVEQIFNYTRDNPNKIALLDGKRQVTYGELTRMILSSKEVLKKEFGIGRGDRVILSADKQIDFVPVYFACHLLEAIAVPISPDTNQTRYGFICDKTTPGLVVGFKEGYEIKTTSLFDIVSSCESAIPKNPGFPNMSSVADILFTTGTTGEPKGVILSHKNIAAATRNINEFVRNQSGDVELLALPISHSFGLGRMRCVLSNGQTLVLLGNFANVKRFFRFIEEYGVSGFGMVPASWALLKKLSGDKIGEYADQLRYIEIGSAPMPIEEKRKLMDMLPNTRICMHYGLTEASRSAFIEFHSDKAYLNTIGKESPHMHISIRDEDGRELSSGKEGEICVAGDAVTSGYLDKTTEGLFWGNSFRTGDWGACNAEGYIILKSRKKELINVGGKKVSPIEVEEVLNSFDFVNESVCVGIADPDGILGEVVKAFIVTDEVYKVDRELMDEMIGDRLEGYKHPVEYEVIGEVPKTSSGKIQRLALTQRVRE